MAPAGQRVLAQARLRGSARFTKLYHITDPDRYAAFARAMISFMFPRLADPQLRPPHRGSPSSPRTNNCTQLFECGVTLSASLVLGVNHEMGRERRITSIAVYKRYVGKLKMSTS